MKQETDAKVTVVRAPHRAIFTNYTVDNLPNNLRTLRTGTAQDGRMLVYTGSSPERQQSVLRDLRSRLPQGWCADIYAPSGVDAVITHIG